MNNIISNDSIDRRNKWVDKIDNISGDFASNSEIIEKELGKELSQNGISSLLDHLRLCGNIPESYHHDSSEENTKKTKFTFLA